MGYRLLEYEKSRGIVYIRFVRVLNTVFDTLNKRHLFCNSINTSDQAIVVATLISKHFSVLSSSTMKVGISGVICYQLLSCSGPCGVLIGASFRTIDVGSRS